MIAVGQLRTTESWQVIAKGGIEQNFWYQTWWWPERDHPGVGGGGR